MDTRCQQQAIKIPELKVRWSPPPFLQRFSLSLDTYSSTCQSYNGLICFESLKENVGKNTTQTGFGTTQEFHFHPKIRVSINDVLRDEPHLFSEEEV